MSKFIRFTMVLTILLAGVITTGSMIYAMFKHNGDLGLFSFMLAATCFLVIGWIEDVGWLDD